MTNLTTIDLTTLNLKNLQSLAKELKIKNWWTMKKADLLISLVDIKEDLKDQEAAQEEPQDQEDLPQDKEQEEAPAEDPPTHQEEPTKEETPKTKKKRTKREVPEKDLDNLITLKVLADEFNMKETKARRLLRNSDIPRPYGGNRWEWDQNLHTEELKAVREYLKDHI